MSANTWRVRGIGIKNNHLKRPSSSMQLANSRRSHLFKPILRAFAASCFYSVITGARPSWRVALKLDGSRRVPMSGWLSSRAARAAWRCGYHHLREVPTRGKYRCRRSRGTRSESLSSWPCVVGGGHFVACLAARASSGAARLGKRDG